jgi:hypothetical protein
MSQEQFTNRSDSSSNQNLDKKDKSFLTNNNKVGSIRSYSNNIKSSRKDLEKYLLNKGIRLVTSFSDFVATNSFIESSFVIYLEHNESIEKLEEFLKRNEQFLEVCSQIELDLQK